jgi:hypothetical protein
MKNICCFPFIFESKKQSPKLKDKKLEPNLQKTFTFFSKLHLDTSKPNDFLNRKVATADKSISL